MRARILEIMFLFLGASLRAMLFALHGHRPGFRDREGEDWLLRVVAS